MLIFSISEFVKRFSAVLSKTKNFPLRVTYLLALENKSVTLSSCVTAGEIVSALTFDSVRKDEIKSNVAAKIAKLF
ncbi:hypothetical protein KB1253_07070 [Lactiplantibacillus plantarum]|nr:hypothetical protein [Lactiplantibacillus plantarum]GCD85549.1 hypothetical protein KB1253_07070 [Lactiplantibacillus plantarum]